MEQRGGDEDGEFAMSIKQGDDDAYLYGMLDSQNLMARKKPQQQLMYSSMKRKTYSKYDLVKVKVYLEDHFYIFSRFLISRVLTLIKVYFYYSLILIDKRKRFHKDDPGRQKVTCGVLKNGNLAG